MRSLLCDSKKYTIFKGAFVEWYMGIIEITKCAIVKIYPAKFT